MKMLKNITLFFEFCQQNPQIHSKFFHQKELNDSIFLHFPSIQQQQQKAHLFLTSKKNGAIK